MRFLGLVAAFDLCHTNGQPLDDPEEMAIIRDRIRNAGLLLRPLGPTLYLIPPLSISRAEIERMAGIVVEELQGLAAGGFFDKNTPHPSSR